jgi:AcrR family transcriptional regulator
MESPPGPDTATWILGEPGKPGSRGRTHGTIPRVSKPSLPRPKVPSISRRRHYSDSTRQALIETAEAMFTERGYAATSLDSIVTGTQVTKGALYHHFAGKQDLFEVVFEKVEQRAVEAMRTALTKEQDPWEKATAGLHSFLEVVQTPAYRRVVMQDGPAVLGYPRFREQEERWTFGIVHEIVAGVLAGNSLVLEEEMVETYSRIFFGAMAAAGDAVSESSDPAAASARVELAISVILTSLRSMVEGRTSTQPVGLRPEAAQAEE